MKLLDLLRAVKAPPAAALREALAQAERERAETVTRLDRLQSRRAELLLFGDDDALDMLERDLVQAQRQVDRLDLVVIQGEERLRQAEEAERCAELDAAFAQGEALVGEAVDLIKRTYPPQARKLLALATRLETIDGTLASLNRRLAEAGDPRRIPDYDAIARPGEPQDFRWHAGTLRRRFWAQLALPSAEEWYRMLTPAETAYGRPLRPEEGCRRDEHRRRGRQLSARRPELHGSDLAPRPQPR